jgi:phosphinothricin acetyltransferase
VEKDLNFRFAEHKDLADLISIYNQAIKSKCATGDLQEFKVEERLTWFQKFDKNRYPLYVVTYKNKVVGYCSLSPYRPGRKAMATIAEISYYLDYKYHKKGIGSALINFVINDCNRLKIKNLLAFVLDINTSTHKILEKFNFKKLGHLPEIIHLDEVTCGHLIYGLKINSSF